MSNHFHVLLEVPPMPQGLSDEELLKRLGAVYTEAAVGGGPKGNGKNARAGLLRACLSHQATGFEVERWNDVWRVYRSAMGLALGRKNGRAEIQQRAQSATTVAKNTVEMLESENNETVLLDIQMAGMLRHRVGYFTVGAVIGSKAFVNEVFTAARERFTPKRKDGARRLRGNGKPGAGVLWSMRDLRVEIT